MVGLGGRMQSHIGSLAAMAKKDNVEIAAICDCDQSKLDAAAKTYPDLAGLKLKTYTDQRKLFDDKSIDAVSFSTQDHWHALQTIWACQAGKDVYVEKPPTWCIWEGRKMVEAARKYKRMVQIGTQNRSSPNVRRGHAEAQGRRDRQALHGPRHDLQDARQPGQAPPAARARGAGLGRLGRAGQDGRVQQLPPPPLVLDRRTSPAATSPTRPSTTSTRSAGAWAWTRIPITVMSLGGRFVPGEDDDADTPNTQAFLCQWAGHKVLVTFEFRHWYTNSEAEMRDKYPFVAENQCVGEIFFGSEGYMIFPDYSSYYTFLGPKNEPGPFKTGPQTPKGMPTGGNESVPHFRNWVEAIRSRKHEDLNADVEQGISRRTVCHLAKISCKLGRSVHFDPKTERFVNDPEADRLATRVSRRMSFRRRFEPAAPVR